VESLVPIYSTTDFLADTLQLSVVAGISYILSYRITFNLLMWWHRRRN
jgi:hypothetical protein